MNVTRSDDHRDQATADLERMRWELAATRAFARPGSALTVITHNLDEITTALASRPGYVPPADPDGGFRWLG
jgi:phosphoglycerate-specific signal transduction histidine kinase